MIDETTLQRWLHMMQSIRQMNMDKIFSDVSKGEFLHMHRIYNDSQENPESQGLRLSVIAHELKVSAPAVSRMMRSLENKGYVTRKKDIYDRRSSYLCLTDEGLRTFKHVSGNLHLLTDAVFEKFGDKNITRLLELWEQLYGIMSSELDRFDSDAVSSHDSEGTLPDDLTGNGDSAPDDFSDKGDFASGDFSDKGSELRITGSASDLDFNNTDELSALGGCAAGDTLTGS